MDRRQLEQNYAKSDLVPGIGERIAHISSDGGKTWSELKVIDDPGKRWAARLLPLATLGLMVLHAADVTGPLWLLSAMGNLPSVLQGPLGPLEGPLGVIGIRFEGGYLAWEHYRAFAWAVFWIGVVWLWPNTQQLMARFEPALDQHVGSDQQPLVGWARRLQWYPSLRWAVPVGLMAAVSLLSLSQISEFLYFQF